MVKPATRLTNMIRKEYSDPVTAQSVAGIGVLNPSAQALTRSVFFVPAQWWVSWGLFGARTLGSVRQPHGSRHPLCSFDRGGFLDPEEYFVMTIDFQSIPTLVASEEFPRSLLPAVLFAASQRLIQEDSRSEPASPDLRDQILEMIVSSGPDGIGERDIVSRCWGFRKLSKTLRKAVVCDLQNAGDVLFHKRINKTTGRVSRVLIASSIARNVEMLKHVEVASQHFNASNGAASGEMLRC